GEGVGVELPEQGRVLAIGKGRICRQGSRVALLSLGTRLAECLKAAEDLDLAGVPTTVADARLAQPLDEALILHLARKHELLVTVEEGAAGGFGGHVVHLLSSRGALDGRLKLRMMVLPDAFLDHDKPEALYARAGLDAAGIMATVYGVIGRPRSIA